MFHIISTPSDPFLEYIKDDPVRPEIPVNFRVGSTTEVLVLQDEGKPKAIVCVAYRDFVPKDTDELMKEPEVPSVAVFYTIWSYAPGAGRDLIVQARKELPKLKPNIKKFVTLSPTTEMAKRFHLKNGASVFRSNENSVNYEYA